jgi:hypothetical protein
MYSTYQGPKYRYDVDDSTESSRNAPSETQVLRSKRRKTDDCLDNGVLAFGCLFLSVGLQMQPVLQVSGCQGCSLLLQRRRGPACAAYGVREEMEDRCNMTRVADK